MSVHQKITGDTSALMRIGSFSRVVSVAPETLRAWEGRYGLLSPQRSAGGFRLYGQTDARLVAAMKRHLQSGMAASEAARRARELESAGVLESSSAPRSELDRLRGALWEACLGFDSVGAHRCIDSVLARLSLDAALRDCLVPLVHELDRHHAAGVITKAQEQFSARLIEARLLAMASGWELGLGPLALIARMPAERHVVGITAFGLALQARGWRVVSLGNAVRPSVLADAAAALAPDVVMLSIGTTRPTARDCAALGAIAAEFPLALGGRAATPRLVAALGARALPREVVAAAEQVAERSPATPTAAAAG